MESVWTLPILLVDDDPQLLRSASVALRSFGFSKVITADDGRSVVPALSEQQVGAIVLDLAMPHISGQTLLAQVAADYPDVPVIVMTATNDLETAVQCMRDGAADYLVKPVDYSRLTASVQRVLEVRALHAELLSLKERMLTPGTHQPEAFVEIITQERAMFAIFRYLETIAPSPLPVLITGETGTGKELVARAVHRLSQRPGEMVTVNVAGLDDTLFADTLFGHARGAYTGAERHREGLVAMAADGTLFLDEIGDLAVSSQVKLLRLLQDGTYYPLGEDRPQRNKARVIVATNCNVAESAAAGTFRKDLYYRLRTHHVELPPLRNRTNDLPLLVNYFVDKAAQTLGRPVPEVPKTLLPLLKTYNFPGNVRELEAMIFDGVARNRSAVLSLQSFRETIKDVASLAPESASSSPDAISVLFPDRLPTLIEAEGALVNEALARANGNQGIAAGMLGISRQALNKRLSRRRRVTGQTA